MLMVNLTIRVLFIYPLIIMDRPTTPLQTPNVRRQRRSSHKLSSVKGSPVVHLDPSIALQLETSLADQARSLLTQLQHSETLRKDLEARLYDLESQEKQEYKYKNPYDTQMTLLESQLSLVTEQNTCLEQEMSKLKISHRQLQMKLRFINDQLETSKTSEASLIQECSELRAGIERETMKHRQALKELQNENASLSAWVSTYKQEKEQDKRQSIFGTPRPFKGFETRKTLEERLNAISPAVNRVKSLDLAEEANNEGSESMNLQLQESLEVESLKASILEANKEAEEWKIKYHQTKQSLDQLEKELSEAQETIESLRETVEEKDTFIQEQSMLHPEADSPGSSIVHRRHHSSYETPNMSPIKSNMDPLFTTKSKRNLMMEFSFAQEKGHQTIETQTSFDQSLKEDPLSEPESKYFLGNFMLFLTNND
jgi:chromosome segregation ATPase